MSYRNLDVWRLAQDLTSEIHRVTIEALPRFEMYEVGSKIRRSVKSIRSNIVEGYGRRRYKLDFIRFLTYALSSCDETRDHLDVLRETRSFEDDQKYQELVVKLEELGKKLNNLISSVERGHRSVRESEISYGSRQDENGAPREEHPASSIQYPASSIQYPASSIQYPASSGEESES